jgi:hypothetical protein
MGRSCSASYIRRQPLGLLQESTVIFAINTAAFYAFYVDLLTQPVPVKFVHPPPHPPHDFEDD